MKWYILGCLAVWLCQYLALAQDIPSETELEFHSEDPKYLKNLFSAYMQKNRKAYKSTAQQAKKFETFKLHTKKVTEHNKGYLNGSKTYFKRLGPHADKTKEEFAKWIQRGFKSSRHFFANVTRLDRDHFKRAALPNSVDLRRFLPPVKAQEECGSCWTFATAATMEYQYNKAKKNSSIVSFSEEQILSCAVGEGENGCEGGYFGEALSEYLTKYGIQREKDYPYGKYPEESTAKSGPCKHNKTLGYATVKKVFQTPQGDELSLKRALANYGVVAIGVDASTFQDYGGGIFTGEGCDSDPYPIVGHAVALVGYGYKNGKGYYILRNSWGEKWGEKGYMKIAMGSNTCGVANDVVYPFINILK